MTKLIRRRVRVLAPVLAMILVLSAFVPNALAGSASGNRTCVGNNSVRIWSQAQVEVWHLWTNNAKYWPNASSQQTQQSLTYYHSTWWTVSWSVSSNGQGTTCYFDP